MENISKGDRTRRRLLEVAYEVIRRKGFQAAGLDEILSGSGLTKGALYHHFRDKTALGYAVLDEIIVEIIQKRWIEPLSAGGDPLMLIPQVLRAAAAGLDDNEIALGCPLGNLSAEMSALDDTFTGRIDSLYGDWRQALAGVLKAGEFTSPTDRRQMATFIVSAVSGCLARAKSSSLREVLLEGIDELEVYLAQRADKSPAPKYAQPAQSSQMEDFLL
jgi:TetR/AcrR family transcriptional regulator, transcriptional repressor for nem operon